MARALAAAAPSQVAPGDPAGPRASAYRDVTMLAPASRATLRSRAALTERSEKMARTCARRIVRTSAAVSPADACPCVESDGMTVPMTWKP